MSKNPVLRFHRLYCLVPMLLFNSGVCISGAFMMAQMVKNLPANAETWIQSLGWEDPLKEMANHSVFLPGKSHGQRSLVGYSPWGCKESDTTEHAYIPLPTSSQNTFVNATNAVPSTLKFGKVCFLVCHKSGQFSSIHKVYFCSFIYFLTLHGTFCIIFQASHNTWWACRIWFSISFFPVMKK